MLIAHVVAVTSLGNERVSLKGSHVCISFNVDIRAMLNERSPRFAVKHSYLLPARRRLCVVQVSANDVA